MMSTVVIQITK